MDYPEIGIGDIGIYLPEKSIDVAFLVEKRIQDNQKTGMRMRNAIDKTGQKAFRFPALWEDTASMAANACRSPLNALKSTQQEKIRYIVSGTETAVDHAKPLSAYVQGMLRQGGYNLSQAMSTSEIKHACAGGTLALLSSAALLGYTPDKTERALCLCSDIARYEAPSTAEITHGAGAVAMVIEQNPRLLCLNMVDIGYFSSDVDDFFRPLHSVTARVRGGYSISCYNEALKNAFMDYCTRLKQKPRQVIDETDYLALHVPFVKMPVISLSRLLRESCHMKDAEITEVLNRTRFNEAIKISESIGNLYTGSLYAYLISLLSTEFGRIGKKVEGRRIILGSYGSGNTMIVFQATVATGASDVISSWKLQEELANKRTADFAEYENWLNLDTDTDKWQKLLDAEPPRGGRGLFYLKGFSQGGARLYSRI